MGQQIKTAGGTGTGLGKDLANIFDVGINTGSFGTRSPAGGGAVDSTTGIFGVLNDLLSGGAGKLGGSLAEMIGRNQQKDIADIHQRYGATSLGTPGAYAESNYRARAAPEAATAIGSLQLSALMPLLQMITGFGGKDVAQSQLFASANPLLSMFEAGAGALPGVGDIMKAIKMGGGGSSNASTSGGSSGG
jgi:hypothetical protein